MKKILKMKWKWNGENNINEIMKKKENDVSKS